MHDPEREARDTLIDTARADVVFLAERQTESAEALDRLNRQAHGDAERLRGAAEQVRRRFTGSEAIPLLETAARHAEHPTESDPAARTGGSDSTDMQQQRPTAS